MKSLILALSTVILFAACTKKKMVKPPNLFDDWVWVESIHNGMQETPQNSGKSWDLNLKGGEYTQSGNIFPTGHGIFSMSVEDGTSFITFLQSQPNDTQYMFAYHFKSNDTLELSDNPVFDGPLYFFVRK